MRRNRLAAASLAAALTAGALAVAAPTASADASCNKTIRIGDAQASEGAGQITFPVTMSASLPGCALIGSVWFHTVSVIGPNPAGVDDYTVTSGQVSWPSPGTGPGQRWITVPLKQNLTAEPDEWFGVSLSNATGAGIGEGLARGRIIDDDPTVTLVAAASTPRCLIEFTVQLSADAVTTMQVSWETINGTAVAGDDFNVTGGMFPLWAGATTGHFSLLVKANPQGEPEETFSVKLTAASPGKISGAPIVVTIPVGWGQQSGL